MPVERPVTILVIEDEPLIRLALADDLRDHGFRVVEAANGDEALAILESNQPIALMLADIRLPGTLDGIDVARWALANRPAVMVLIASANPQLASALEGITGFVPKPYVADDLAQQIRAVLKLAEPESGPSA